MRDTGSVDLKDPARIIERSVEVQDDVYPEVEVNPKVHPESNLRSRHSRRHHSTITMQTHRQTDRQRRHNQSDTAVPLDLDLSYYIHRDGCQTYGAKLDFGVKSNPQWHRHQKVEEQDDLGKIPDRPKRFIGVKETAQSLRFLLDVDDGKLSREGTTFWVSCQLIKQRG